MNDNSDTDPAGRSATQGMTFPSEVDIKVFARATDQFEPLVRELLADHLATDQVIEIRGRESSGGKYHSLSCKVIAHDREELDRVFSELSGHPDILMVI